MATNIITPRDPILALKPMQFDFERHVMTPQGLPEFSWPYRKYVWTACDIAEHASPAPECSCGFHALLDIDLAMTYHQPDKGVFVCTFQILGKTIVTDGIHVRSEGAYTHGIFWDYELNYEDDWDQEDWKSPYGVSEQDYHDTIGHNAYRLEVFQNAQDPTFRWYWENRTLPYV